MPEPKNRKSTASEPVDWAERLKASMADPGTAAPDPTPTYTDENDDLAALLRAQLAKQSAASDELDLPDLSEFEEEEEEPEEDYEPDPEEDYEPDSEEDYEPDPEEDYEPDPEEDYEADPEEDYEADPEEDYEAEPEEDCENDSENEPEEPLPTVASMPEPSLPPLPTTDSHLNALTSDSLVGDERLRALDEENTRLLQDIEQLEMAISYPAEEPADPAEPTDPTEPRTDDSAPAESEAPTQAPAYGPAPRRVLYRDPMQTGLDAPRRVAPVDLLDAEMPVGTGTENRRIYDEERRVQETPSAPAPSGTYADRVPPEARTDPSEATHERDTDLYLHLGYENDLRHAEEQARVETVRTRAAEAEEPTPAPTEAPPSRLWPFVRLLIAAVGALGGLCWDFVYETLRTFSSLTFADTYAYSLVSLGWIILISVAFLPCLGRGLLGAWRFRPTRYTPAALALLVGGGYTAVALWATVTEYAVVMRPLTGVTLTLLAVTALADLLAASAKARALHVATSGKPLYLLTDEDTPAAAAVAERAHPLTAVRTDRIPDLTARTERDHVYMGKLNYYPAVALLAAIVAGGVSVALGGHVLRSGLYIAALTCLACLPVFYLIALTLPHLAANRRLGDRGAAILGEASATDETAAEGRRILIPDGEALVAVNRMEITVKEDPHADEWRRLAARLFLVMDSPLLADDPIPGSTDGLHAELAEAGDGYTRLYLIDGDATVEVLMGTHDALTRRGVRLPKLSMEQAYKKSPDARVLYLAFDGRFRLAYAVEYRPAKPFLRALDALRAEGCAVSVVTYDPLVTDALLATPRFRSLQGVTLVRPASFETRRRARTAAAVATGQGTDLAYTRAACRGMRRTYRLAHLLAWASIPLSLAAILLATALEREDLLTSPTAAAVHLILSGVAVALSWALVNDRTLYPVAPAEKKPAEEPKKSTEA